MVIVVHVSFQIMFFSRYVPRSGTAGSYGSSREQTYGYQWGWVGERIDQEFWMGMYTLLCLKQITNKDLLYSTGNSARCYVAAWMGGEFGGECMCMCTCICMAESLPCSPETTTMLLTRYTRVQFSSVQFSRSVVSDSLRPHESQHARPPCQSPTPGVYPNSCTSSR